MLFLFENVQDVILISWCYSRQAGHRFGEQLWRVAPQVLEYSTDADEELREHCLQALEAFVLKCPKEVQPHIPTVIICVFSVVIEHCIHVYCMINMMSHTWTLPVMLQIWKKYF